MGKPNPAASSSLLTNQASDRAIKEMAPIIKGFILAMGHFSGTALRTFPRHLPRCQPPSPSQPGTGDVFHWLCTRSCPCLPGELPPFRTEKLHVTPHQQRSKIRKSPEPLPHLGRTKPLPAAACTAPGEGSQEAPALHEANAPHDSKATAYVRTSWGERRQPPK